MQEPDYDNIISTIHTKIFTKEFDSSINIFLCGASSRTKDTMRDKIYEAIENDSRFNVVFPEWLFGNLLKKGTHNLLELENLLANDVDVIVIPLEGFGTFAELGVFASNKELQNKIIVINDIKYKNSSSFVNLGPIALVRQTKKNNLYFFEDSFSDDDVKVIVNKIKYMRQKKSKFDLDNIFNLARFIQYLIAIFQPVDVKDIQKYLSSLKISFNKDFITPSIEILIRKGKVLQDSRLINDKAVKFYLLSPDGHNYIYEDLLNRLNLIKSFGRLRARILNYQNRKLNLFKLIEGSVKFLDEK